MRNGFRYGSLYERIVANSDAPSNEQGCWQWRAKADRSYYGRLNVYVPGLGRQVCLMTHLVMWITVNLRPASTDAMYLAYLEIRCSRLEVDHLCRNAGCVNPDHLDPRLLTHSENCQRRNSPVY